MAALVFVNLSICLSVYLSISGKPQKLCLTMAEKFDKVTNE